MMQLIINNYEEDFNHLLDQPDYEDHLVRCIVTNNIGDVQSAILRKRILQILKIIETEINKEFNIRN